MADTQVNIEMDSNKDENIDVEEEPQQTSAPKSSDRKKKGRGFGRDNDREVEERYSGKAAEFETLDDDGSKTGPQRCKHTISFYLSYY